jgi:hypothetical protein
MLLDPSLPDHVLLDQALQDPLVIQHPNVSYLVFLNLVILHSVIRDSVLFLRRRLNLPISVSILLDLAFFVLGFSVTRLSYIQEAMSWKVKYAKVFFEWLLVWYFMKKVFSREKKAISRFLNTSEHVSMNSKRKIIVKQIHVIKEKKKHFCYCFRQQIKTDRQDVQTPAELKLITTSVRG